MGVGCIFYREKIPKRVLLNPCELRDQHQTLFYAPPHKRVRYYVIPSEILSVCPFIHTPGTLGG